MAIIRGLENVPTGWRSAVTLGAFDGVHRGHQALIARTVEAARDRGLLSVVLTFDPHPDRVLRPDRTAPLLTTIQEKTDLLAALAPEQVVVARFDAALADTEAEQFVRSILIETLGARYLVVGPTLTFGRDAFGNAQRLQDWAPELGIGLETASAVVVAGQPITSSAVREALLAGNVDAAREMLGRPYSLTGTVERGTGRGRELGYPTANIRSDPDRLIPADGVYAVEVEVERTRCQGVASIGSRPTFADADRAFEVYLPGLDSDLCGLLLTVRFWKRLRGQIAFEDPEALAAQMALDVRDAKRALAGLHLPCDMIE